MCVCVWVRVCMDIEGVIWRPSTCIRNSLPSTLHPSQSFHTRMHMCMHALIQTFTNPYNTQTNLNHKQPMQTQGTWWVHLVLHICRCCGLLQCVAVCCSVLQCVAVCCSVLWENVLGVPPTHANEPRHRKHSHDQAHYANDFISGSLTPENV